MNKAYFYQAAKENGVSVEEYLNTTPYNYVIIDNGTPLVWQGNDCPVIFGDTADAKAEIAQWGGEVKNVSIITEKEMIGRYCFDEYTKAIKDIAEEKHNPLRKQYKEYKEWGGDATYEQFERGAKYCKLNPSVLDGDIIVSNITSAFGDMFVNANKGFKAWYEKLSEDAQFNCYGDIIEKSSAEILNYVDNPNEYNRLAKVLMEDYTPKAVDIMDTGNGHSRHYVDCINDAWRKDKESFKPILCVLYERDIDEITDSDAFRIPKWESTDEYEKGVKYGDWEEYMRMALNDMKERWDVFADNYLMHIADDGDLECIVAYLHYPYLPKWK